MRFRRPAGLPVCGAWFRAAACAARPARARPGPADPSTLPPGRAAAHPATACRGDGLLPGRDLPLEAAISRATFTSARPTSAAACAALHRAPARPPPGAPAPQPAPPPPARRAPPPGPPAPRDPLHPGERVPGVIVPAPPRPEQASSCASASACAAASSRRVSAAPPQCGSRPSTRSAIFVPSRRPSRPAPSPAGAQHQHLREQIRAVSANSCRNRPPSLLGMWPAQITRNATSCWHSRSIRREEVIPFAYAQISNVTSMSGS